MDPFVELSSSGGPNDENYNHSNNDDDKDKNQHLPAATTTTTTTAAPAPPHTNTNNHKHTQLSTLYVPTVKVILPLFLMEDAETATTGMMSHTHAWCSSTPPPHHQHSGAGHEPSRRPHVTRPLQRQPATASTNRTIVRHILSVAYHLSQFRDSYHASPRLVDLQQVIVGTMVDWFQHAGGPFVTSTPTLMTPWTTCAASGSTRLTVWYIDAEGDCVLLTSDFDLQRVLRVGATSTNSSNSSPCSKNSVTLHVALWTTTIPPPSAHDDHFPYPRRAAAAAAPQPKDPSCSSVCSQERKTTNHPRRTVPVTLKRRTASICPCRRRHGTVVSIPVMMMMTTIQHPPVHGGSKRTNGIFWVAW